MKLRNPLLGTLLLVATVALSGTVSNQFPVLGAEFSCQSTVCPNPSKCSGDHFLNSGTCAITCYKDQGTTGQIVYSGSAHCGATPNGGGGGGGGGGYEGGGGYGGYCYENWMWDAGCSGPDDSYQPIGSFGWY